MYKLIEYNGPDGIFWFNQDKISVVGPARTETYRKAFREVYIEGVCSPIKIWCSELGNIDSRWG